MNNDNDCIKINFNNNNTHSVIWLHGLGANGEDFVPLANNLKTNPSLSSMRFILPNAPYQPISVNQGAVMRAWFDITSFDFDNTADTTDIKPAITTIHSLIDAEHQQGIPKNKIFLGGFSQGAALALVTALNYPEKLAGVLALSGYVPNITTIIKNGSHANNALPIFIGHGQFDELIPLSLGDKIHHALSISSHPTTWHQYPMGHSVCNQEIIDITNWLVNLV